MSCNQKICRSIPLTLWLLLLVAALAVSCAPQKKVVPQVVKVRKCYDCHPEFRERLAAGIVHAPVGKEDCYSCHMPHGIYGKIILRILQPDLCYSCHESVKATGKTRSIHEPVHKRACSTCHNPHNSPNKGLLKEQGDESCFQCHDRSGFNQEVIHSPLSDGCATCHDPHTSENVKLLHSSEDDTCRRCHDTGQQAFQQSHFENPVNSGCVLCHTPHSSEEKNLLKENVHSPVREGECGACHLPGTNSMGRLKGRANELCLSCHEIETGSASSHEPYSKGQCFSCHDPHASDNQSLLVLPSNKSCLTCHDNDGMFKGDDSVGPAADILPKEQQEAAGVSERKFRPASHHKPVREGKCLECHWGHRSDKKKLLRENPSTLCFDCHKNASYAPEGGSHPQGLERSCQTCHAPHVSRERALLDASRERDLCFNCHKATSVERGKFSQHKPFARGECGACHSLHGAKIKKGFLNEVYTDGTLCTSCHGAGDAVGENIVTHQPVVQGNCRQCHSPHAGDYEHVLKRAEDVLCYECHSSVQDSLSLLSVKHQPVTAGECTKCHTAHGSPYQNILKNNQPVLCLSCHTDTAAFWLEGTPHRPALENCLQCHHSHGAAQQGLLIKQSGEICADCHETGSDGFVAAHNQIKPGLGSCVKCHSPHGGPEKNLIYPVVHRPFAEGSCEPCHTGGKK